MFDWIGIPVVFIGLASSVVGILAFVRANYIKCSPNEVLIFFGRKHKIAVGTGPEAQEVERGYRVITGGGAFRIPMLEEVKRLSLATFQVDVKTHSTPNKDGVLINVDSVANLKISSDPETLAAAIERLLAMNSDEVQRIATTTLEGQQRQILGTLTVEEIVTDREKITQQVLKVTTGELGKIGLTLDNFVILSIEDAVGYIEALGKRKTAEVQRDAEIGEAEAKRDSAKQSTAALREGQEARLKNEQAVAEAQRDLDVKKNELKAETEQTRISAEMAPRLRQAELQKDLVTREQEAKTAEAAAGIQLAEQDALRVEKQMEASTIKPAEAKKQADILTAEGTAKATELAAEASKKKIQLEGEGQAAADAVMKKEVGNAEAAVQKAKGEAAGSAIAAKLVAEADGLKKKNEALATMSDAARLIIVLEQLPQIIEKVGVAGEQVVGAAFEPIGLGLSRIDSLDMVNLGGGNGHSNGSGSTVVDFATSMPEIVFTIIQKARALGIDVDGALRAIGLDVSKLIGVASSTATVTDTDAEAASPTATSESAAASSPSSEV